MAKTLFNKLTIVTSPIEQSGKTTIANNLAYLFAKQGYVTCVIELNRYIGTSPYLNAIEDKDMDKSLKTAMNESDETQIVRNFIQSSHSEMLFTLSLRLDNQISDLYKYDKDQIEKIIKIAVNKFDKVFLDTPMNYLENGFIASMNSVPEQTILVMDNNIVNWHKLKLYDLFFKQIKYNFPNISCIMNKDSELIPDKFVKEIKSKLQVLKIKDTYSIPFMPYIIKSNNEGVLFSDLTPSNKLEKKVNQTFSTIYKNIESNNNDNFGETEKKSKKEKSFSLGIKKKNKKNVEEVAANEDIE